MPPERLIVDELVVRVYAPADAPALVRSVAESLEHLRPFMPWVVHEPMTVEQRIGLIEEWNLDRTVDGATTYGIFHGDRLVGGTGLHRRSDPGVFEIGYWVHVGWVRRGIATRVSRALTTVALATAGVEAVEIRHDVRNGASGRVPGRLGYRLVEEARRQPQAPGESGWMLRWRMDRSHWPSPPASGDFADPRRSIETRRR